MTSLVGSVPVSPRMQGDYHAGALVYGAPVGGHAEGFTSNVDSGLHSGSRQRRQFRVTAPSLLVAYWQCDAACAQEVLTNC